MFGSVSSNKPIASMAESGLSQSFVGIKVEESIGYGWTALAKAETGFQPLSGELSDGCASLARMNGIDVFHQISKGDSSRCGQIFNGPVYAGVSNSSYGTLTVGRQNSLNLEMEAAYDPLALSYAFSLIGYSGSVGGGFGDTEASRWDNSVKYVYQYGPVHAAGMYANGSWGDVAIHGDAYGANVGGTFWGISIDAVYSKENSVISSNSLSAANCSALGLSNPGACQGVKVLSATVSDNTGVAVGAKYTFDFGGGGGLKDAGGLKDGNCCCTGSAEDPWWCGKLTLYFGYQRAEFANPTDLVIPGQTTIGGYVLGIVNNNAYVTDRILETWWAGAKYDLPANWSIIAAYYRLDQNHYLRGTASATEQTQTGTACFAAARVAVGTRLTPPLQCTGELNMGSFVVDYTFNKYFDIYSGVNYSEITGGLSSGFIHNDSWLFMSGARLRF
jgi:predicted porin